MQQRSMLLVLGWGVNAWSSPQACLCSNFEFSERMVAVLDSVADQHLWRALALLPFVQCSGH